MKLFSAILCAAALCAASPALAQTESVPGGDQIWDLSAAANPRHWHTGLTCWESAGETPFTRRIAYNPTGSDVSCSYGDASALVTLYATQRPSDATFDDMIAGGRRQVTERYRGANITSDRRRTIQTSTGALEVDELVFAIEGEDVRQNERVRGSTGVWHADVAGWTLKLRLSDYRPGSAGNLPLLAEQLLGRAYAEMQTARACANAGREQAPNLHLTSDEGIQVQVSAAAMMPVISNAIPETPLAARRAGFVCLGETLVNDEQGLALVGVFPAQQSAQRGEIVLLGLGEVRPASGPATMVALVDMSMNPFGIEDARTDRGHFMFSKTGRTTNFYGVLNGGVLRETLAWSASRVNGGATPIVTSTPPQD